MYTKVPTGGVQLRGRTTCRPHTHHPSIPPNRPSRQSSPHPTSLTGLLASISMNSCLFSKLSTYSPLALLPPIYSLSCTELEAPVHTAGPVSQLWGLPERWHQVCANSPANLVGCPLVLGFDPVPIFLSLNRIGSRLPPPCAMSAEIIYTAFLRDSSLCDQQQLLPPTIFWASPGFCLALCPSLPPIHTCSGGWPTQCCVLTSSSQVHYCLAKFRFVGPHSLGVCLNLVKLITLPDVPKSQDVSSSQ